MATTIQRIYAGADKASMVELPSPVSITKTEELIWDAKAGRATEGEDIAKMIGTIKGRKATYEISWGLLTQSEYSLIMTKMHNEFFCFAVATSNPKDGSASVPKFYRSDIKSTMIGHAKTKTGQSAYVYKDVSVSVVQQ